MSEGIVHRCMAMGGRWALLAWSGEEMVSEARLIMKRGNPRSDVML